MHFSINIDDSKKNTQNEAWGYHDIKCDCLVLGVFEDYKQLSSLEPRGKFLSSKPIKKILDSLSVAKDFSGQLGETFLMFQPAEIKAVRLLFVGLGLSKNFEKTRYFEALDKVADSIKKIPIKKLVCNLVNQADLKWGKRIILHAAVLAYRKSQYKFSRFKNLACLEFYDQKRYDQSLEWVIDGDQEAQQVEGKLSQVIFQLSDIEFYLEHESKEFFREAVAIADGINLTRNLANAPSNICTPSFLAKIAKEVVSSEQGVTTEVHNFEEAKREGLGAFLAVAKGSSEEPYFIIIRYQGVIDNAPPTVLIGKGVTFDSGGISLKPAEKMDEMRYDMSGAATVLGSVYAAAKMRLPINLIGIIPACENMPSGKALKPGDIIKSLSGKTIEILNTDAEGRLILCDALTYAKRFSPSKVIDIATLTGACVVALGHLHSGLFSNSDKLAQELLDAGNESNDTCWRLPLDHAYKKQLESNFADIANIGGRAAGSVTAASFLSYFAEEFSWAHLDIAGTAWSPDKKGSTGRPVHLLINYLLKQVAFKENKK